MYPRHSANLVNFIQKDNPRLRALHRIVGIHQQLSNDGLDVFAHVASLREGGAVADRKRYVQTLRDGLRQQGFTYEVKK